jgi:phosphoheptose isomerase
MKQSTKKLLDECMERYPQMAGLCGEVVRAFDLLLACYRNGGKVLLCGNGGSAADAEHVVGELMKGFLLRRPVDPGLADALKSRFDNGDYLAGHLQKALTAISLVSQTSLVSAIANDNGADMVFAQQVLGYARPGDVLLAFSTSGNSPNVVNACKVASVLGCRSIGFTGESGGAMKGLCDIILAVPSGITFMIQELHLPLYHVLCAMLEEEWFGPGIA